MTVQMDLPELGLTGEAIVIDIQAVPDIEPPTDHRDTRQVVTATFHYSSGDVIDLVVGNPNDHGSMTNETPPTAAGIGHSDLDIGHSSQTIGTPSNHPFWSEDRQEFVQAGSLEIGERLQTLSGDVKVVQQKLPRPGPQPVFNLEVHAEHVYCVGLDGLLVHNSGPYAKTEIALGKDIPGGGYKELATQTGASRWQNWLADGITRRTVENRFGRAYHQAADRASAIHFSLDGIDDVAAAVQAGKRGFIRPDLARGIFGNMTNAELHYIFSKPELLKKTTFYRKIEGIQQAVSVPNR